MLLLASVCVCVCGGGLWGVMRLLSPQRELESNLTANVLKDYANFNI